MKRLALSAALMLASLVGANALSRDFKIHNDTPFDIAGVYFSTPNVDRWIHSSNSGVSSGGEGSISFANDGPCEMQMRVNFANGHYAEWVQGFNFCTISEIFISYDRLHARFDANYR